MGQFYSGDTPGIWPPSTHSFDRPNDDDNDSGTGGSVPPEITCLKWNWGAFGLPFLWAIHHRIIWGWTLIIISGLVCLPGIFEGVFALVYFGISIFMGLQGHRLGWQNRRFQKGLPEYFATQRHWMFWGIVCAVLNVLVPLELILNPVFGGIQQNG